MLEIGRACASGPRHCRPRRTPRGAASAKPLQIANAMPSRDIVLARVATLGSSATPVRHEDTPRDGGTWLLSTSAPHSPSLGVVQPHVANMRYCSSQSVSGSSAASRGCQLLLLLSPSWGQCSLTWLLYATAPHSLFLGILQPPDFLAQAADIQRITQCRRSSQPHLPCLAETSRFVLAAPYTHEREPCLRVHPISSLSAEQSCLGCCSPARRPVTEGPKTPGRL